MPEKLHIDFESRSTVDLKTRGLGVYVSDPSTEILCMAYAFGDEPVELWLPGESFPSSIFAHIVENKILVAHNAQFEIALWHNVLPGMLSERDLGWFVNPAIEQFRCTMAACYAMALPGALENAASALGLKINKDTEGRALMLKMCKPRGYHQDGEPLWHETQEQLQRLGEYCKMDVEVERAIDERVLSLTENEQRIWVMDQEINTRGIPFDMPSLEAAIEVADIEKERLNKEMKKVTGAAVAKCSNVGALKSWAADFGVMKESLAKAEINELIDEDSLPEEVKQAMELRRDSNRFTSISKLNSILKRQVNGRVPFVVQYHAASTGRWAGRGIQPHNFTRDLPKPKDVEEILRLLRERNVEWLDIIYGQPSIMISKCLRGFIKPEDGNDFMGGDFSSVEGRGVAWLAGEDWKIEAFRECDNDPELPDMYERSYAASFRIDPLSVTPDQRQIGKVQELAFGYQGGKGAFHSMAKNYGVRVSDSEADALKDAWRDAHPNVKQYWYDVGGAAINAVLNPGEIFKAGAAGRQVAFRKRGSFLWCRLPSGRVLCYPYPQILKGPYGNYLTIKSVPSAQEWGIYKKQKDAGEPNTTSIVDCPGNSKAWARISTYGGKLVENITQATCRDLLAHSMLQLEKAGYNIVLHVHDEAVTEGRYTAADLKRFKTIMSTPPAWAADFPLAAACWMAKRYQK